MGDYYKIKKILLILLIVSVIFRIINQTKVFATEATEVTPVWNDGTNTYQADNQFLTLRQNQIDIQNYIIYAFFNMYDRANDTNKTNIKNRLYNIYNNIYSSDNYGTNSQFVWFNRLSDYTNSNFGYQIVKASNLNNIVYADALLDNGYKLLSVPFYSFSRTSATPLRVVHRATGELVTQVTSGNVLVPVAELGFYSTLWIDLFKYVGIINTTNYDDFLSSIYGSVDQLEGYAYSSSYYAGETSEIVGNTYDFIIDDNIDNYTSLGISQPNVTSQIDLTSVFDEIEILLTDEDYTSKAFTFSLPGNRNYNFSLNPNMLETNLTRVGGYGVIEIIHACWFIALYGWYIFAYLRIFSKLISGDWLHLVGGTSPTNKLVKISVGSITGGGY